VREWLVNPNPIENLGKQLAAVVNQPKNRLVSALLAGWWREVGGRECVFMVI
jgi:hypothetical protein